MKVSLNVPASAAALSAALEGLVGVNYVLMQRARRANRSFPPLYEAGVLYKPEPVIGGKRREEWLTADRVLKRRHADCEDLAGYRAAELRMAGVPARAVARRSGPRKFHAVVRWPNGQYEDPSRILGMGRRGRRR